MPTWPGVDHRFTRREELVGERVAEPASRLHRPDPLTGVEPVRPAQQLRDLPRRGPHEPLAEHVLDAVDGDRGVGALVRSMPIMTIVILRSPTDGMDRGGHS